MIILTNFPILTISVNILEKPLHGRGSHEGQRYAGKCQSRPNNRPPARSRSQRSPLTSSTSNWYFSPQAIFLGKFVSTQNNHYYYPHPYHDYHADCGQVQGSQGKERKGIVAGSFKELVEKGE